MAVNRDPFNRDRPPEEGVGGGGNILPPPGGGPIVTTPPPPPPPPEGGGVMVDPGVIYKPGTFGTIPGTGIIRGQGRAPRNNVNPGGPGTPVDTELPPTPPLEEPPPPIIPPPPLPRGRDLTLTRNADGQALPFIYGEVGGVGGLVIYRWYARNGGVTVAYAVCHGPIDSINDITIDGQPLSAYGLVLNTDYKVYTGTAGQSVDTLISGDTTSWTSALPGIAYVVIRFKAPTIDVPAPDVYKFTCRVRGMLVRDPRTDATLVNRYYRDNPALIIADVLTSKRIGNIADAKLDFATSWTTSANDCDFDIDPGGGTTARFRMGLALDVSDALDATVDMLRAHARLQVAYNNGIYQCWMDKSKSASSLVFIDTGTEANIVSASLRVKGSAEVPNHVVVRFLDADNGWVESTAEAESSLIYTAGAERVTKEYNLPGCRTYDQARRIAIWMINRSVLDKEVTMTVLFDGARVLPGTVITVTSADLNMSSQAVIVTAITPDGNRWKISGEIYDAAAYSDTIQTGTATLTPAPDSMYSPPGDLYLYGGLHHNRTFVTAGLKTGDIFWHEPWQLSTETFASGLFSGSGWTTFTAANLVDGNIAVAAATANAGATGTCTIDLGSGQTRKFRQLQIWWNEATNTNFSAVDDNANTPFLIIEYSDNGSSWTAITKWFTEGWYDTQWRTGGEYLIGGHNHSFGYSNGSTIVEYAQRVYQWVDKGAHRYWRFRMGAAASVTETIYEVKWSEVAREADPHLTGFNVYRVPDATSPPRFVLNRSLTKAQLPNTSIRAGFDSSPYSYVTFDEAAFTTTGYTGYAIAPVRGHIEGVRSALVSAAAGVGCGFGEGGVGAEASATSGPTLTSANTWYTVSTLDTETRDTHTFHSTVTNSGRFTVPSSSSPSLRGLYKVAVYAGWLPSDATAEALGVRLRKNGSTTTDPQYSSDPAGSHLLFFNITLTAGDYIEVQLARTGGSSTTSYDIRVIFEYVGREPTPFTLTPPGGA